MPAQSRIDPEKDVRLLPHEAAHLIKVAPKTLANWRASNTGPRFIKLSPGRGGRVRYPLSAVTAWLAERESTREVA